MSNLVCIVQARMSSTRLPGKVLLPLSGRPVISHVFGQLSFSRRIEKAILATSTDPSDDPLEKWAKNNGTQFYRGSLDNVLDRFYSVARAEKAQVVVRITADCPLIDPEIVDSVIGLFEAGHYDYCSNANPASFPDGLDVEVLTFSSLESAFRTAKLKSELEHVTPFIRNHPELFSLGNLKSSQDYADYRLTLDNREDYELLKVLFENLYRENAYVRWPDVLNFLQANPQLLKINQHIARNEGYQRSLNEENSL